ncbi:hypothetical protein J3R80_17125 [Aliiroseovarius sp. Z3]|uniref:hypothetical protein n=1 Tax=Aliiroseovarius sp. Z3 TaxID=2811402 RepID=UPI0023B2B3B5|nr:hypothetical protein [Aliiroseovarius sp. Z3]MDE9452197.1 hypothetical protein [Aliiroseovarius sp. Z3]
MTKATVMDIARTAGARGGNRVSPQIGRWKARGSPGFSSDCSGMSISPTGQEGPDTAMRRSDGRGPIAINPAARNQVYCDLALKSDNSIFNISMA